MNIIHVNTHNIRKNHTTLKKKPEDILPVFTYITEEQTLNTNGIVIKYKGEEVARLVYSPKTPLPTGARAYIQLTESAEVEIDTERNKT